MQSKEIMRRKMRQKLSSLSAQEKNKVEMKLYEKIFNTTYWKQASTIGITISQGYEWETKPIIEAAWSQEKQIAVPKCYPEKAIMEFYILDSYEQLESVYYHLLEPNPVKTTKIEPDQIDLLIVPGLVFDQKCYRIGHGGGYYDRFLVNYKGNTLALASVDQIVDTIPCESFDIPVDLIITDDI